MESNARKKRSSGSRSRKEKRETTRSGSRTQSSESATTRGTGVRKTHIASSLNVPGMMLSPETAKQAIILSEIIGKPVSKRGNRR